MLLSGKDIQSVVFLETGITRYSGFKKTMEKRGPGRKKKYRPCAVLREKIVLTQWEVLRYNVNSQGKVPRKEGFLYAENLSAEEAPQKERARFQEKNV